MRGGGERERETERGQRRPKEADVRRGVTGVQSREEGRGGRETGRDRHGRGGRFRSGCARPGNALDAASSRGMSHRRYGKPVRLGYKAPSLLLSSFLSQRRCLSSVSSRPRPFVPPPAPSPTLCLSSIIARSLFYLLSPPPPSPSPSLSPPSLSLFLSLSTSFSLRSVASPVARSHWTNCGIQHLQSSLCRAAYAYLEAPAISGVG